MIRPYADDDLPALLDVWYRASVIAHPFLTEEFLDRERAEIAGQWLPVAETCVYEVEGRLAGFIAMLGNEVGGLFVDPELQRRGIGSTLVDHVRKSRPYLELDVFEANVIGRAFYDVYGFRITDRHLSAETGQPELHLRLDEASSQ